jgi:hypothetical protein
MKSLVLPRASAFSIVVIPLLALSAVGLGGGLLACGKEAPKKVEDNPSKTTPVPSDMVFNDFVPTGGGGSGVVGVKVDGGIPEGGMAAAEGTAAAGGADEPAASPDGAKLTVTAPGAEPRVARKYAFVANRADRRLVTIKQSAGREGGGPAQEAAFALTADFTPKAVKPTGTRFEMKVVKLDLPGVPAAQKAQALGQLAAFTGLTGAFDITPRGEVGEVDFKADEKMAAGGAEMIIQSLQQALELLVPPFPDAPIGVGATWERKVERKERGMENSAKHSFTLKEVTAEGGVVTADVEVSVPKHVLQQRGVPPGATEEVKGKGSYTYAFKLDHISSRVDGEMTITRRIELLDPKSGQKQSIAEIVKLKNTLEGAGGAAAAPAPKP